MIWKNRHLVRPEDLNGGNTLYGGQLMKWIDEAAAMYVMCQLGTKRIVTKTANFDFIAPGNQLDIIEIGTEVVHFGRTSIAIHVIARNQDTQQVICELKDMVFVSVDANGRPTPHGKSKIKTEEKIN